MFVILSVPFHNCLEKLAVIGENLSKLIFKIKCLFTKKIGDFGTVKLLLPVQVGKWLIYSDFCLLCPN